MLVAEIIHSTAFTEAEELILILNEMTMGGFMFKLTFKQTCFLKGRGKSDCN